MQLPRNWWKWLLQFELEAKRSWRRKKLVVLRLPFSVLCIEQQHPTKSVSPHIFYRLLAATSLPHTFRRWHAICTALRRQFATMTFGTIAYLCATKKTICQRNFQINNIPILCIRSSGMATKGLRVMINKCQWLLRKLIIDVEWTIISFIACIAAARFIVSVY